MSDLNKRKYEDTEERIDYHKNKIINLIGELNKISINELVEVRKQKYLNITSDI